MTTTKPEELSVVPYKPYDLTLRKEAGSWLDGKSLFEYHPDPLAFSALKIHPEVDSRAEFHKKRMNAEGVSRVFGTGKEEIAEYQGKYNEKHHSKEVKYMKAKHKWGRARCEDWCCMATMERTLRTTLWRDYYTDLDIENCHPVILGQILKGHIDTPHLDHYLANRNEVLAALMGRHSITRDEAKQMVCVILFGGQPPRKDAILKDLMEERNGVEGEKGWAKVLCDANPELYESARQKNMSSNQENRTFKHINTTVSWILQELEYRCFCSAFKWAEAVGLLTAPGVKELEGKAVGSYIYDGGCILTTALNAWKTKHSTTTDQLCGGLGEVCYKETGLRVKWLVKEWGAHYDITEQYLELKHKPALLALTQDPEMPEEEYCRIWESRHLKITSKGIYIEEGNPGDEPTIRDEQMLRKCYGHLWNGFTEGKFPKRKNWLLTWLVDNHKIRSKEGMDIYPNPAKCPANMYNLWVPFPLTLKKTWVQNDKAVQFFVNHIQQVMCPDGEAQANYMLDWIAHMLQRPEEKVGKCPIFTSRGGVGKGRTVEMFKALLGEDKVYDPEKPERDVWGEFNGGMKNAFLVVLDELASHKTTKALGELKHIITEPTISIRLMRTDPFKMKSHHRVLANTNDEDAGVEIGTDNRRFWVNRASEKFRGNTAYWTEFDLYITDPDAMKSLFEYFMARKIESDFRNPEATPLTAYHKALARENTPSVDLWVEHIARENWVERDKGNPILTWTAEDTAKRYITWCEQTGNRAETEAPNKLSRILTTREYGLCGASSVVSGARGKAMRTFNIDKCLHYFKKCGLITDEQYGFVDMTQQDPRDILAIEKQVEKKMKAQQEKAMVIKIQNDMAKRLGGEAKRKMLGAMKGQMNRIVGGGDSDTEEGYSTATRASRAPSKVPTRCASPETSEDDMDDLH